MDAINMFSWNSELGTDDASSTSMSESVDHACDLEIVRTLEQLPAHHQRRIERVLQLLTQFERIPVGYHGDVHRILQMFVSIPADTQCSFLEISRDLLFKVPAVRTDGSARDQGV